MTNLCHRQLRFSMGFTTDEALARRFPPGGSGRLRRRILTTPLSLRPKHGVPNAHTMQNHSKNLRRKLNVGSSLEVVMFAVRMGLLEFDGGRLGDAS